MERQAGFTFPLPRPIWTGIVPDIGTFGPQLSPFVTPAMATSPASTSRSFSEATTRFVRTAPAPTPPRTGTKAPSEGLSVPETRRVSTSTRPRREPPFDLTCP